MSHPIIRLEHIDKQYGIGDVAVMALHDVTLTVEAGEMCAIMGPSGSGKSTVMNVIGCLDRPTGGEYYLDGEAVAQLDDEQLAAIRNLEIGFVFQQFHLLSQLSALENVMLPMTYAGIPYAERSERAVDALARMGLAERIHNYPNQLSGGEQQRVAIARAIVNQPMILLADEPTGALDTKTSQEVMAIFRELNASGMTLLVVTHDPEVGRLCQRVIWFRDGEVLHEHLAPSELSAVRIE